ncbi:MAG: nuclear transport factor 2 family protein [Dehalococcoidales bacterium]|nr:nuclear transport factor 2 family protein [Dehalococcoidales bacterium]
MTVEEMEARIKLLERKVRTMEDIEDIKKLQRAYGFYLEHWMAEDIIDLFAEGDDTTLLVAAGEYQGKEAIRRFFRHGKEGIESRRNDNGEFLHQVIQLSGVVHIDPEGKTARGRWYGFGANAFPQPDGRINPGWMNGVYEVDYVKQDNIWKLKKVHWCMTFHAPWTTGFVDPSRRMDEKIDRPYRRNPELRPTGAPEETLYPSGFICPFHFDNPVSGRKAL